MLQREHDLDQSGGTGGGLQVPDVGLGRSHQQRPVRVAAGAVDRRSGLDLDRVAQWGSGAVRFEVIDILAAQACPVQRGGDESLLGAAIGHRQATGGAVLVDRAAADHRKDVVAVALRIAESFEHQNPATLTAGVAVCSGVEGFAAAVGGQHPGTGSRDDGRRAQQHVDPTGQGHVAVAGVQRLGGLVHSDQRGTARGVHGNRRTLEAEGEGHPTGDGVECVAGDEVALEIFDGVAGEQMRIFVGCHPDEDAGVTAAQRGGGVASPFQCLPGDFEHQALLRVDPDGLAR